MLKAKSLDWGVSCGHIMISFWLLYIYKWGVLKKFGDWSYMCKNAYMYPTLYLEVPCSGECMCCLQSNIISLRDTVTA